MSFHKLSTVEGTCQVVNGVVHCSVPDYSSPRRCVVGSTCEFHRLKKQFYNGVCVFFTNRKCVCRSPEVSDFVQLTEDFY